MEVIILWLIFTSFDSNYWLLSSNLIRIIDCYQVNSISAISMTRASLQTIQPVKIIGMDDKPSAYVLLTTFRSEIITHLLNVGVMGITLTSFYPVYAWF